MNLTIKIVKTIKIIKTIKKNILKHVAMHLRKPILTNLMVKKYERVNLQPQLHVLNVFNGLNGKKIWM